MNLEELSGKLRDLPEKEKNAILTLIDYQIRRKTISFR